MSASPILLVGGTGFVGKQTVKYLRAQNPDISLLIGARNLEKAQHVAAEIGNAEGVALDLSDENLGLGNRDVSAVAVFFKDDTLNALHFAQSRKVPHVSISSGVAEIAPEVAAYMNKPDASAIVLGAEWLVGATTIPAIEIAKNFAKVDSVKMAALMDEQDKGGPATDIDMQRLGETLPAALTRKDGAFYWRVGEDAQSSFRAIDGQQTPAFAMSPYDVMGLFNATNATNITFDLAIGETSSRRQGQPLSTEIIIEISGTDHKGQVQNSRHAVFHPHGQMPLTALGVTMTLERLLGLDGKAAPKPGLYFPCQLLNADRYFKRLEGIGGKFIELDDISQNGPAKLFG